MIAAMSGSRGIPDRAKLPLDSDVHSFHMPRYSLVSVELAMKGVKPQGQGG